jgi:hypothetical protein
MKSQFYYHLTLVSLVFLASCAEKEVSPQTDTEEIIEQVTQQVNAFQAADTTLNSEEVVDLLWPEFTMLVDGNPVTYANVKASSGEFMSSLESFNTRWDSLKIIPLGDDHAISSFIFTDSIVAKDGTLTQTRGPNTFVWERREGEWKVIYADADHYPIEKHGE